MLSLMTLPAGVNDINRNSAHLLGSFRKLNLLVIFQDITITSL